MVEEAGKRIHPGLDYSGVSELIRRLSYSEDLTGELGERVKRMSDRTRLAYVLDEIVETSGGMALLRLAVGSEGAAYKVLRVDVVNGLLNDYELRGEGVRELLSQELGLDSLLEGGAKDALVAVL